jgi:hypothetical protein
MHPRLRVFRRLGIRIVISTSVHGFEERVRYSGQCISAHLMQLSRFRSQMLTVHVITSGIETTLAGERRRIRITQLTSASFGWHSHWTGVKIKTSELGNTREQTRLNLPTCEHENLLGNR